MKYTEFNERKQHGSQEFPIQYYFVSAEHPQYEMSAHWHREFEIVRVLQGEFCIYLDNTPYHMQTGDIVMIECGTLHRGEPLSCAYECVVFNADMLRRRHNDVLGKYITPIINHSVGIKAFFKAGSDPEISSALTALITSLKEETQYFEFQVYSNLFTLVGLLYQNGAVQQLTQNKRSDRQIRVIMGLIDWIDANYNEAITLSDLAHISGMNEKYLCRFFKEFTNRTPIDYINSLRIECACHEMTANRRTVTESALVSGFNDLSYFSKMFKKYKGMSPRSYQQTNTPNT